MQPGSTVNNTAMSSLTDDSWMYGDDNLAMYRNNEPQFCASGINSVVGQFEKQRMHQKSMMKYSVKALLKTAYRMQIKIGSLHLVLVANEMEKNNTYTNGIYLIILDLCCLFNLVLQKNNVCFPSVKKNTCRNFLNLYPLSRLITQLKKGGRG